ncbi:nuclear transport factor 2 family protein [Mycobacterium sp. 852002-40037_SCH5390672]|uniref:nuclear transport factor 2 family protein n=1 Tax=Mycobacterium sp. 852002-40037_SCH5390672 TaxID=1834089 RepID=UPI000805CB54|nr:nuclear transport factor 2 family protein [Mycobacterium sp. 852002-40037_SCH5390672]OBB93001.1 polyketide cyclase [Mycobacterium sp. 852002-40037_SCH5390672]
MTDIQSAPAHSDSDVPKFSAEVFAAFWAAPTMSRGFDILAEDIVGFWPGDPEPVRGIKAYSAKIAELLEAAPDLRLEVIDSATVPGAAAGEELVFLHYVGQGNGPNGPFRIRGIDRVRTRNGIVIENVIRYDPLFVGQG